MITIKFPTDDREKAIHTLDGLVKIFNHWYGGSIEYELQETSWKCVPVLSPAEKKMHKIQVILVSSKLRTTGEVIKQIGEIVGVE